MTRLYSDEQLREIGRPPEDHALEALKRGDLGALRQWLQQMALGPAGLDALSVHTLARKAGKLRQDFGEEKARAALRRIGRQLMATWVAQYRAGDVRGAVADLIAVFRHQQGAALEVSEDADSVLVSLAPCGSGGRVDVQGMQARHAAAYGGWSDGVNSFCQGCRANQDALNTELGVAAWTSTKGPGGQCRLRFDKLSQRGHRLFSDAERAALAGTRVTEAQQRLDAGDTDVAPLLRGQRKEWMPWHDFGIVWLAHFYAVALELGGADYLSDVLDQTYAPAFVAGFPRYAAMDDETLLREIARTWNYHCADFRIREEPDRFVFELDPCGSGGRLLRGTVWRDMFRYGRPLSALMPEAHPINFMRRDAPSYCTHCAASNRPQLQAAGDPRVPLFFVVDGHAQQQPGMPCRMFVYKKSADRERIDPALFAQLGLPGPASA